MPPRWGYVGLLVHWLIEPMNPMHIVLRWSVEIGYIALLYTCRPAGASAQKRGKRETQAVLIRISIVRNNDRCSLQPVSRSNPAGVFVGLLVHQFIGSLGG